MFSKQKIELGDQIHDLLMIALLSERPDINEIDVDKVLSEKEKSHASKLLDSFMIAVLLMLFSSDQQANKIVNLSPKSFTQEEANHRMSYWFGYYAPIVLSQRIGKEEALKVCEQFIMDAMQFLSEAIAELEGKQVKDSDIFFAIAKHFANSVIPTATLNIEESYRQHVVMSFGTQIYRRLEDVYKKALKNSKLVYTAPQEGDE